MSTSDVEERMDVNERLQIVEGDITKLEVDAIVNAANTSMLGGGGVDGAIHRAAGPGLLEESRKLGGCPVGEARVTGGYDLSATWVIHAVGPVWRGGSQSERELLASAYRSALAAADEHGARTMAFPLISTGVYGFPMRDACRIALREINSFLGAHASVESVYLVCFGKEAFDACRRAARRL